MARLAKVCVTPAEPLGDRTAELALKLDELSSVRLAHCITATDSNGGAIPANQLFWFVFGFLLLCGQAIFHSSKVWLLTLEAHIVGQLEHGPRTQVVVESIVGVGQALISMNVFEFGACQRPLLHVCFQLEGGDDFIV